VRSYAHAFADWMVQDRLKESKQRVLGQRSIVESIRTQLQREYDGVNARLEAVAGERKRLLESLS
jgi:hypothetical protein